MSDNLKFVQCQATTLAGAGATATDDEVILTSFTDPDGNQLTMTDFGSIGYGTIEPNSGTNEEQISFTGVTVGANSTTLTGVSSIGFVSPYTPTANLAKTHAGGTTFVISNTAGFYDSLTSKSNDETITGIYTFTNSDATPANQKYPQMTNSGAGYRPINNAQLATKDYVDFVGSTGTPDSSTSAAGKVQEATNAQIDADTAAGSSGAPLFTNPAYLKLSKYYLQLPTTDQKAALAGSGTPSGANKFVTADTDALKELLANKDTTVTLGSSDTKYPTQNAVKTYVDNTPPTSKNGTTTKDMTDADGTQTIAHGLSRTPKKVRLTGTFNIGSLNVIKLGLSNGVYNGTTNSCVYTYASNGGNQYDNNSDTYAIYLNADGDGQRGVVTVDGTNITITWTRITSGATGTAHIMWEAQ